MKRIITRVYRLLPHGAIVLSLMFMVFLVLDVYNPLMQFVDSTISRWLLAVLTTVSITNAILLIRLQRRGGE